MCSTLQPRHVLDHVLKSLFSVLQFASTVKSRTSPDLEKGESAAIERNHQLLLCHRLSRVLTSEEEEEDEEESDEETRDLVLQSSSLSAVDEEKDVMAPPAKQPRMGLNLQ